MIVRMESMYEKELTNFLYKYNNFKEHFIAWVPDKYDEISALDKNSFMLCIEDEKIIGCLGTYISYEQRVVRLMGPIIANDYFDKYVDIVYERCIQDLPQGMSEIKVAFFDENILCKLWCDNKGFELYNTEKTMVYNKELFVGQQAPSEVILKPYEDKYREGLGLAHPEGTFFTLNELINQVSEYHHLVLALVDDEVVGYIYYEQSKDKREGEIALLHVRHDKRCKGYGTILLNSAIERLYNDNVEYIFISVRVNNYDAQRLYSRIGFEDKETIYAYRKHL